MSNKAFFGVVIALVVVALGGAILFSNSNGGDKNTDTKTADVAAVSEQDHVKGAENAVVTLIEYGDFQCPFCAQVHPLLAEVLPEYEDTVQFVFRHFPLTNIHQNALVAHRAAEAAGNQDKFFEMHDLLYERQALWSTVESPIDVMKEFAEELELDVAQFEEDLNSSDVAERVRSDRGPGEDAGVESTPTLFLNGDDLEIPRSADELRQALDAAIAEANTPDETVEE